mmetsp:Transcript_71057/g.137102  ORF Transcript_71057/g.137102 Transcript_71057/m.137102 type:complete len:455 (+) Transcript_71057:70-1434(+)
MACNPKNRRVLASGCPLRQGSGQRPWLLLFSFLPLIVRSNESPLSLAFRAKAAKGEANELLLTLRKLRNSHDVLNDIERLYSVTAQIEQAMNNTYESNLRISSQTAASAAAAAEDGSCDGATGTCAVPGDVARGPARKEANQFRPGNFHGVKSHSYYVGAISEAHPNLPPDAVQSIVASEWYHPSLTAKAVWCTEACGEQFRVARRLDANAEAIQQEVQSFWRHPDAAKYLAGVGAHTTQFDRLIAGNGTWVDVRLWRGRAFNKQLCEQHFRVICALVEASPEVWTNPWSHVLLSILLHDSWVPFHQGHTNGQLTYHFPVTVSSGAGRAELAVVERGGSLQDDGSEGKGTVLSHPEERTVTWTQGKTLVFDDSFTHAVRYRVHAGNVPTPAPSVPTPNNMPSLTSARVVLLMRGWHPELQPSERAALREFVRRGGEEDPEGYEMLPISPSVFSM